MAHTDRVGAAGDGKALDLAADRLPASRLADASDTRPLTDAEHAEHLVKVRELLDKARADGLTTVDSYLIDPDGEAWERDRRHQHDVIIDDLYTQSADAPCERRAVLAGGPPGAGKTTVLEKHAGIELGEYLMINPDQIKVEMAKRGLIPEVSGLSPMEASDLVHEESSHIAKQLALRAMADGKNLIWDITMRSRESTEKRILDLRSFGYVRVDGIFVDTSLEVAGRRVDTRHREDHDRYRQDRGYGGRVVPPEVAEGDLELGSRNRRVFEEVKPKLDGWWRYDNSVDGRDPVLVESGRRKDSR